MKMINPIHSAALVSYMYLVQGELVTINYQNRNAVENKIVQIPMNFTK
jgi:hypothetical protein